MKNKLLLLAAFLLSSCNSTVVNVEKKVFIIGFGNHIMITGSELKDNQASQSADGAVEIPLRLP